MNRNTDPDSYRDLEAALGRVEAPPPPPDLAARCLSTIPTEPGRRGWWSPGRFPWAAVSATAVCTAGAAAGLFLLAPGAPLHPTPAFSDVEAAMRSVHTAHWTESMTLTDPQRSTPVYRKDNWVRLDPPAFSETWLPIRLSGQGSVSSAVPQGSQGSLARTVSDPEKEMMYIPGGRATSDGKGGRVLRQYFHIVSWPQSVIGLNNPDPIGEVRQHFLRQIVAPSLGPPSAAERAHLKPGHGIDYLGPQWTAKSTILNGRSATLFERKYGAGFGIRLWADPITHRLLRREVRSETQLVSRKGGQSKPFPMQRLIVDENFEYDQTPPPGTFDLTPPPGAVVVDSGGPDSTPAGWKQLPETDRKAIQVAIAASEAAWRAGDFTRLARVWDFDYLAAHNRHYDSGPVRRAAWKFRTTHQVGRWSRWESQVESASVGLTNGQITVRVRSQGQWRDTGEAWQGIAEYTLRRDKDGWRIVDWNNQSLWNDVLARHDWKRK